MGSKVIVLLGIFLALILLISSEVLARELTKTSDSMDTSTEKAANYGQGGEYGGYPDRGYGGGYPGHDGHGGGYPGYGGRHSGYPGHDGHGGGYPSYGGGHSGNCRYGCCGGSNYGGGNCHCCNNAGQMAEAETQAEPRN